MQIGNISRLFMEKKYGKIRAESGKEIHFNEQCLWDIKFAELREGQEVEFEVQPTYKGFLGFNIRPNIHKRAFGENDKKSDR